MGSIMVVGVGGQGSLLASKLLGNVLTSKDYDVKVSEVHGMSQRGGSVVTYVKYGDVVHSPTIENGEADAVVAFELLEGARYISSLKEGGVLIVNTQQIDPMPVITGAAEYPSDLVQKIKDKGIKVIALDALDKAVLAGNTKAVNVVMMGVLAKTMDIALDVWVESLKKSVKEQFIDVNLKAFELGYNWEG